MLSVVFSMLFYSSLSWYNSVLLFSSLLLSSSLLCVVLSFSSSSSCYVRTASYLTVYVYCTLTLPPGVNAVAGNKYLIYLSVYLE